MRLLFFCAAGIVAGKERQTLTMMKALQSRGHDIFCVMASWGNGDFEGLLRGEKIPYARMRTGFISKSFTWPAIRMTLHQLVYVPSLWRDYRRLIRTFHPDAVVHTNFHHLFLLLPVLGNARQVFYVHDYMPPGRFTRVLFRKFNQRVELFIGVSRFICDSLPPLGVTPQKVRLVYNGVVHTSDGEKIRNGDDVVVGIVGQVAPWKGHEILIRALGTLANLKGWRLQVIGEGIDSFINELRYIANAAGIAPLVEFKGSVAGLDNIYGRLDIVTVPSVKAEAFGLTAVEPALFRIPVICSSIGALPEVVIDGDTGIVVPPGDVGALAEALRRLIGSATERKRLGNRAMESARKRFSMNVTVGEFEKAIAAS
jgi:glycosyltransferase involved in cell wall biosynthesis